MAYNVLFDFVRRSLIRWFHVIFAEKWRELISSISTVLRKCNIWILKILTPTYVFPFKGVGKAKLIFPGLNRSERDKPSKAVQKIEKMDEGKYE